MDDEVQIHLVNLCRCEICIDQLVREAEAKEREQLQYHNTVAEICCGDCPQCWCHY